MKKVIVLFIILFPILQIYSDIDYLYVNAFDGLNIRTDPNLNSKIIKTIAFGEKIILLEINDEKVTIDNITGSWVKVKWNNLTGWMFNGYLSKSIDDVLLLQYNIYIKETNKMKYDDNYIFKSETLRVIDIYNSYYTIRYHFYYPKGQEGDLVQYSVFIKESNDWKEVYSTSMWDFNKLLVRDINDDNIPDLITWTGGCCAGNYITISVYLGNNDKTFNKKSVKRVPDIVNNQEYSRCSGEWFVYNGVCSKSVITGSYLIKKTDEKINYKYIFDCNRNIFIKE